MATSATTSAPVNQGEFAETIRVGLLGGLVGGVVIWIYEAIVWVGIQHLMPLTGIPRNATGLVFGKGVQDSPNVIIGGFISHLFYAVPLALIVKRRLTVNG